MNETLVIAVATVAIIGLSAFFVAVEFALMAARRHRLADEAVTSRGARAALRSANELTVLLAGSQLGITVCTLALGAVTKPAVHHWLTPTFESWGAAPWLADVAGFVLALVAVTFLHLVVGEMAPKSWAIAHPERSARLLAIPMRGFMALTRPLLRALNACANWCLRRVGVEPVEEAVTGRDPQTLRHLVEHSALAGTLESGPSEQLTGALDLAELTLADLVARTPATGVPSGATVADVQAASRRSGHLRILVGAPSGAGVDRVVHVRDTLDAAPEAPVDGFTRPAPSEPLTAPAYAVFARMRATSTHLVVVTDGEAVVGVVTVADILRRILPAAA